MLKRNSVQSYILIAIALGAIMLHIVPTTQVFANSSGSAAARHRSSSSSRRPASDGGDHGKWGKRGDGGEGDRQTGAIEQSPLTVSKFTNPSFFFINRMEFGRI